MTTGGPFDAIPLFADDLASMQTLGEPTGHNSCAFDTAACRCPACRAPAKPLPSTGALNPNTGHGHVRPRPDGVKARCGGPALCSECAREAGQFQRPPHPLQAITDAPPLAPYSGPPVDHSDAIIAADLKLNGPRPPGRTVVAFTGLAGSGKSTAAQRLVECHGYERVRFAGPLKAMAAALGLTQNQIEGTEKETPCALLTHEGFATLVQHVADAFHAIGVDTDENVWHPLLLNRNTHFAESAFIGVLAQVVARGEAKGGATPRLLMQMIGTEWGRDMIGPTLWVDLWRDAVDKLPPGKPVVVDDCRFPNEAEAAQAACGTIVRIVRADAVSSAAGHSSERQALPHHTTIDNSGVVGTLFAQIDQLARDMTWAAAANK